MKQFHFTGRIPASKSLMNRALIIQSYEPRLKLEGDSSCDDVVHLRQSLRGLKKKKVFDCGEGGTTLRFLAFRLSREKGEFLLKGTQRLLSRPQKEIKSILVRLGVDVAFENQGIRIRSSGWKDPKKALVISAKDSSQFLSALFLNAWGLDFDLKIKVQGKITSESYFVMTLKALKDLGFKYTQKGSNFVIPKGQRVALKKYLVESDLSSLFSVASFAAVSGEASFKEFPKKSLQPDLAFTDIFRQMGVRSSQKGQSLSVRAPQRLKPVRVNLKNSPDLFPVLAVLCSFSEGKSILFGAPQLALKESNRILKTAELLKKSGIACTARKDGIVISGNGGISVPQEFSFDPDKDHRLAMAAALLKFYGHRIKIKDPDVVRKSFPEFWRYVGVRP
ncbi:3-phosphoshikimate 1-carboxyvinyltransferase [Bdellovibrio sp. HCB337]|uniref:3-phosphoshikimate 1-carboxyvinyltransferase n=1 Tax=Bdellovibrio sp. HCB337 TaxID=3394358 RepID=UPI0039A6A3B8